mmetsp:Transcript_24962/g.44382  ORF Transcript_24962/g.44382 Transcript_24962/m.44382 type:complete len:294 (+) Transcript_24962:58-939(+)
MSRVHKSIYRGTAGTLRKPISSEKKLNERTPRSRRFKNVKSVLNTGTHVGNIKMKISTRGEIFKRIGRTTLWKMIKENEEKCEVITEALSDLTMGVGSRGRERKVVTVGEDMHTNNVAQTNFLLLDLRDEEVHSNSRILGAMNFSIAKIRRDSWDPKVYAYKNKTAKLIILYDETESKMGSEAATLMVQKGFDNIRLLTGGFKHYAKKYIATVLGDNRYVGMPDSVLPSRIGSTAVSRNVSRAVSRAGSTAVSRAGSVIASPVRPKRRMNGMSSSSRNRRYYTRSVAASSSWK